MPLKMGKLVSFCFFDKYFILFKLFMNFRKKKLLVRSKWLTQLRFQQWQHLMKNHVLLLLKRQKVHLRQHPHKLKMPMTVRQIKTKSQLVMIFWPMMVKVGFELGPLGLESAMLSTRPWEYYLYLMQKSLDLYLVNLDMALLVRAISMSFLNSLCEEVSESMVSSSGIQFFTRLD